MLFWKEDAYSKFRIDPICCRGNWSEIQWEATESGDGTVPEHSAVFVNAQAQYPFCVNHGDIYVNPAVLEVLNGNYIANIS